MTPHRPIAWLSFSADIVLLFPLWNSFQQFVFLRHFLARLECRLGWSVSVSFRLNCSICFYSRKREFSLLLVFLLNIVLYFGFENDSYRSLSDTFLFSIMTILRFVFHLSWNKSLNVERYIKMDHLRTLYLGYYDFFVAWYCRWRK